MPGCCGTARWTRSACCVRAISRWNCAAARADLPSRVADNLFWLGRYAERAENIARLLRTLITRVRRADEAELGCLLRLHGCLDSRHSKLPKKQAADRAANSKHELISLMTDPSGRTAWRPLWTKCIASAEQCASGCRPT